MKHQGRTQVVTSSSMSMKPCKPTGHESKTMGNIINGTNISPGTAFIIMQYKFNPCILSNNYEDRFQEFFLIIMKTDSNLMHAISHQYPNIHAFHDKSVVLKTA